MIAARRILERGPTTLGTAVHVGREGIMREIGYRRYENATNTIQFSVATGEGEDRQLDSIGMSALALRRSTESLVNSKFKLFTERVVRNCNPVRFSMFGIAIKWRDARGEMYLKKPEGTLSYKTAPASDLMNLFQGQLKLDKPKHIVRCKKLSEWHHMLAENAYVLAIMMPKQLFLPFMVDEEPE